MKKIIIFSITEVCGNGDVFTALFNARDSRLALDLAKRFFDTESNERKLVFNIDWKDLETDLSEGNEWNEPFQVEPENGDSTFYITAKVLNQNDI